MLLRLNIILLRFEHREHWAIIHSFPSLYSIPVSNKSRIYLSILPLMHIWIVSYFVILRNAAVNILVLLSWHTFAGTSLGRICMSAVVASQCSHIFNFWPWWWQVTSQRGCVNLCPHQQCRKVSWDSLTSLGTPRLSDSCLSYYNQ